MFARPSLGAAVVGAVGRTFGHPPAASGTTDEEPIRAELFGIERLEQHAESLAARNTSAPARAATTACKNACATTTGAAQRLSGHYGVGA